MSLLSRLKAAAANPPRRPAPSPLTGPQRGLIRAASRGQLVLDTWYLMALVVTDNEPANVTPDVAVLMRGRYLRHDPVDFDVPPQMRPRFVRYHPTAKGDHLLMAAAAQRKKGSRRD